MYTEDKLRKFPYFAKELENTKIEYILDTLTGVVSRAYIIGFAKSLIAEGTPFSFIIIDLDNFKFINDNYGHSAGDGVLVSTSSELAEFLDGFGVVGRFGGDELLAINLRDITYQEKKNFFLGLYSGKKAFRKNFRLENCCPFVTATSGCASFPEDADDYNTLFSLIDKTLYRGKTKGRNCYIIYLAEKHKDIEIKNLAKNGIYTRLQNIVRRFELVPGLENKLNSVTPLLMEEMKITDLYYVGKSGIMRAVCNTRINDDVSDISRIMRDDVVTFISPDEICRSAPIFCAALKKMHAESFMVARIGMDMHTDGYLVCAEPKSRRIWQEDEKAMIYFLAKMTASVILINNEEIPQ